MFKNLKNMCEEFFFRNVTTEHLFSAIKHFFGSYSITFSLYMCTTVQNCAS